MLFSKEQSKNEIKSIKGQIGEILRTPSLGRNLLVLRKKESIRVVKLNVTSPWKRFQPSGVCKKIAKNSRNSFLLKYREIESKSHISEKKISRKISKYFTSITATIFLMHRICPFLFISEAPRDFFSIS